MTRGPWPVGRFAGSWRFKRLGAGLTLVVFRYHVSGPRGLRWLVDPIMRWWFQRETVKRLAALKVALER